EPVFGGSWVVVSGSAPFKSGVFFGLTKEKGSSLMKTLQSKVCLKGSKQAANIGIRPAEAVVNSVFRDELVGISPAEVVLNNSVADDYVSKQNFVFRPGAGHAAANPGKDDEL